MFISLYIDEILITSIILKNACSFIYWIIFVQIVPHVDSLSLNEQELTFFSHIANGPYTDLYPVFPGAIHVYKVSISLNNTVD